MRTPSIGIHVMMLPASSNLHISSETVDSIKSAISTACLMNQCIHHETYVGHDHIHFLIEAPNEERAVHFVQEALASIIDSIRAIQPEFEFDDGIHVTLLPPWHIDILSSFVRDQPRYHLKKSVQDELEQVFNPGLIGTIETRSELADSGTTN
jgi:hypothetical protein